MINNIINEIKQIDATGIIAEYLAHKFFDAAIPKIKTYMPSQNKTKFNKKDNELLILSTEEEIIKQIIHNVNKAKIWSYKVTFNEVSRPKLVSSIFVHLDFYLTPVKTHLKPEYEQRYPIQEVIDFSSNYVILGGPGAGKTTLSMYLCRSILEGAKEYKHKFTCPIVIRLREIDSRLHKKYQINESLYYILIEQFGIQIQYSEDLLNKNQGSDTREKQIKYFYSSIKRIVSEFIDELEVLVILDGFDEISSIELKKQFIIEINEFSLSLRKSKLILTSRTGEFDATITNAETLEICPLSDVQIKKFISNWLMDEEKSNSLYNQIQSSPFRDTVIRPLNIAQLCALYERYNKIPEQPKEVYKKIINLLVEDWDSQRAVERVSNYSNFSNYRKSEFLSKIAFILTVKFKKSVFSRSDLISAYDQIYLDFGLPKDDLRKVLNEIEGHTGLFVNAGSDRFEFSHKSIQEYLTAEYIVRSPIIAYDIKSLIEIPNELAIAVSLSLDPNLTFAIYILSVSKNKYIEGFLKPFFNRLLIEKPDFNNEAQAAYAIMWLYNLTLNEINAIKISKNERMDIRLQKIGKITDLEERMVLLDSFLNSHNNILNSFKKIPIYYSLSTKDLKLFFANKGDNSKIVNNVFEINRQKLMPGLPDTLQLATIKINYNISKLCNFIE